MEEGKCSEKMTSERISHNLILIYICPLSYPSSFFCPSLTSALDPSASSFIGL